MSKNRNRVAGVSGLAVLAFLAISIGQASAAVIWDGLTPAPNDSTSWAGLGTDGATIPKTFSATSTAGVVISGSFAGNQGLAAVECPAAPTCSWNGGFTAGDHLIWTFDNSTGVNAGSGPLTLGFGTPVLAGGLLIQSADPGMFTAQVQAFSFGISLGTFTLASDAAGDPIFIGAKDIVPVPDITSLAFDLTACTGTGCDKHSFAVDTLRSVNPGVVPAPLIGHGLPVILAVGALLFGGRLLTGVKKAAAV
jgi:hypothetical protein